MTRKCHNHSPQPNPWHNKEETLKCVGLCLCYFLVKLTHFLIRGWIFKKKFCVHSSYSIISMGKRELIALLWLSSWCLAIVVLLFLTIPQVCLQLVIVVFPDHTHLLFLYIHNNSAIIQIRLWMSKNG